MKIGNILPVPYSDELLYSVITRYHLRINNESPKWTLREVFGTENVIPTLDLPSHLAALASRSEVQGITANDWIEHHTFFSYYAPFLPKERADKLRTLMKSSDGSGIHTLVGITASSIDRLSCLRFCPSCYEQDIQQFGEPYWHRIHQLPGVYVCHTHQCILHEIKDPVAERHGLTVLPISRRMFRSTPIINTLSDKLIVRLLGIVEDVQTFINLKEQPELYDLRQILLPKLFENGFMTTKQHIRQQQLEEQFILFYGRELLELLQSNPTDSDYSWLSTSTRKPRRVIHPIRQFLLIRFLFGSFKEFLDRTETRIEPFGSGPWPCLNQAAEHYKDLVVTTCNVTRCSDTGRPVGTFTCSCGFSYSRRGPDRTVEDTFHIGRIKSFGAVWAAKLKQYMQEGLSYRSMAKLLGVDTNTVIKYSSINIVPMPEKSNINISPKAKMKKITTVSRNLPKLRVDWEKRDLELSWKVETACEAMLSDLKSKPTRISIAHIGKRVGKLSWLEKHSDKLPVTMSILVNYLESVSQFQKRRVCWAADQMQGEWPLKRWKLERLAGLRPDYSQEVSEEIERCISQSVLINSVISTEGGGRFMARRKLKTWPFPENEKVELIWFGSPFKDYKGNWRMRVAFRSYSSGIRVVTYPWGTLPASE